MSRFHDNDDSTCGCKKETDTDNAILKCKTGSSATIPEVPTTPATLNINRFSSITVKSNDYF